MRPLTPLPSLARALRLGELRLEGCLDQLELLFQEREPSVLAFVPEERRFDRLRQEARELLERFPKPEGRPPLFGVPVGVKDVFHVDGFRTRAGSQVPPEALQGPEAESVAALKRAGALILGKTVTTEFAYFAPGPTRNPHDPERTPGGSSSGSAAAVAAGLCPLAMGTQTIGSVIRPASFCGVAGFKPSYDRISRAGLIPLSPSLDHVGLFATAAEGIELGASVLCEDWRAGGGNLGRRPVLGIPEGPYLGRATEEGRAHFRAVAARLVDAGYTLKSVNAMPDFEDISIRQRRLLDAEAAQVHSEWFARFGELYHPTTAALVTRGQQVSPKELAEALAGREKLRGQLTQLIDEHGLDLWISPAATGPAPLGLDSTGDPVMNLPWTHSGLPTLGLPSGLTPAGLPMGLQVTARWWADEDLLGWAVGMAEAIRD